MVRIQEKLRPTARRSVPQRPRSRLSVEALENRVTPIIAILVGHPVPPVVLDLADTGAPPVPVVQFDLEPVLTDSLTAGESTTALSFNGQASATVSLSPSAPGAPGSGQDIIIIDNYHYRLTGAVHESVTLPTAAAPGTFSISLDLSGTVGENIRFRQHVGAGRVVASVSIHGSASGTWMKNDGATTTIVIQGGFVTDTAIHQTETMAQSATMGPQSWTIDAVTHTTGFCDGSVRMRAGHMPLEYKASTTLTNQFQAQISPTKGTPPGAGAPASFSVGALFMATDISQGILQIHGSGALGSILASRVSDKLTGMLNESVVPSSGGPFGVMDALDASGLVRDHVIPQVVLIAPTALAPSGTVFTTTPTFSWTAVNGADFYFLTIIDETVPEVIHGDVLGTSFTPGPSLLTPGHTYVWFVQALNFGGAASPFSNTLEFAVAFGSG